jgi:hypothetical protein
MELGEKWRINLTCNSDFHVNHRYLLHAEILRNGTHGFTSPPKEGMLWSFSPEQPDGFGHVRTCNLWIPEATMLTARPPKPLLKMGPTGYLKTPEHNYHIQVPSEHRPHF